MKASNLIRLTLFGLIVTACAKSTESSIEGQWYGFAENGRYYELYIDSGSIYHYESYRENDPFFNFPMDVASYTKDSLGHWIIEYKKNNSILIKAESDSILRMIDPVTQQSLEVLKKLAPTDSIPPRPGTTPDKSKNYQMKFILREVNQLAKKQNLSESEKATLSDSLQRAESLLLSFFQ